MVKKVIFVFSAIIFLSIFVIPVSAANDTTRDKLEQLRLKREEIHDLQKERINDIRQKQKEVRQDLREKVATRAAELKTKAVGSIKDAFLRMLKKHEERLARLDAIAEKIATRIDKLKERGVNTSAATAKLATAEGLGTAAESALADAKTKVEAIDPNSSTPRDAVAAAKSAVQSSRQALMAYHKSLVEVLRELKSSNALREGSGSAR